MWLSVAQLKLTHLMHKTIRYNPVLLRMQIIPMYVTEHNARQRKTLWLHVYCWQRRYQGMHELTLCHCFLLVLPNWHFSFDYRAKLVMKPFFRENTFFPPSCFHVLRIRKIQQNRKRFTVIRRFVLQTVLSDIARSVIFFSA